MRPPLMGSMLGFHEYIRENLLQFFEKIHKHFHFFHKNLHENFGENGTFRAIVKIFADTKFHEIS